MFSRRPALVVAVLATVAALLVTPAALARPAGSSRATGPAGSSRAAEPAGLPDGVPAAATRPEPLLPRADGWPFPEDFPRTSGTGRLDGGASLWTDWLYDAHGAQGMATSGSPASLAPPRGTYRYPPGPGANNGADIFRVGVGLDAAATYWRVDWTTLVDANVPVAEWTMDDGGRSGDAVTAWPAGAGIRSTGVDHALVVSARGAWLYDASGVAHPIRTVGGSLTVDLAARSFVVRLPRRALAVSGTWRIRLASGLANAAGDGFRPVGADLGALPGQPAVYNVTFRTLTQEPPYLNPWMEATQAATLTGGDVSRFALPVSWGDLAGHRSTPEPLPTGYSNRWYVSSIEPGQGVVADRYPQGDLLPNFLDRVQPYAVYVPSTYRPGRATPLTWILHSLGDQHNQYGTIDPAFLKQACEARGSICVTPLGRGPDGWYYDEAELDFWEVWNRLASAYTLDPDRTVISGYSMGGWGTYKLAMEYPSLFAKAVAIAAPPVCGIEAAPGTAFSPVQTGHCHADGDSGPLVVNARWLPFAILQGAADELVPVTSAVGQADRFDGLGYRYRLELFPTADHLGWAVEDLFASAAADMGHGVRTSPSSVPGFTFRWYPELVRADLGLGPSGAYWVSGLAARVSGPGRLASVVARSEGPCQPVDVVRSAGPVLQAGAPPGAYRQLSWTPLAHSTRRCGGPPSGAPGLTLALTNVGAIGVNIGRAGLDPDDPRGGRAVIDTDGRVALTVAGLLSGLVVSVDGRPRFVVGSAPLRVALDGGHHTVVWSRS